MLHRIIKLVALLSLSCWPVFGISASFVCHSQYQGKMVTQSEFNSLLKTHQQWLQSKRQSSTGQLNVCSANLTALNLQNLDLAYANLAGANLSNVNLKGVNLSHANLMKIYLRNASLDAATLTNANLQQSVLDHASLKKANLRQVNMTGASAVSANFAGAELHFSKLKEADFHDASFKNANLSWANLSQTDLQSANFSNAILVNADLKAANLSNAVLLNANMTASNLSKSNLINTDFYGADLDRANLSQALFQPKLHRLPNLIGLTNSVNFRSVTLPKKTGVAVLVELRLAYKRIGIRSMERQITAMIKVYQLKQTWRRGGFGYIESALSYVFFYLSCDYGAAPSRPILILLWLIVVFGIPYRWVLSNSGREAGILVLWHPERYVNWQKVKDMAKQHEFCVMLKAKHRQGYHANFIEQLRLFRIAIYFSLLNTFSIGWHELNVRNWITRLQMRDYWLQGKGWVRLLAGIQPVISAYLIVLWILVYFGRPFEW